MSLDHRLVEEFTEPDDDGVPGNLQPELHVVGLSASEVGTVVEHLSGLGARWDQPPDVERIVAGQGHVVVRAEGITLASTTLPALSMFIFADSVEFFWDSGPPWTEPHVAAFTVLLGQVLDLASQAVLRPDPEYPEPRRHQFGRLLGEALGRPDRIDYGGNVSPWLTRKSPS